MTRGVYYRNYGRLQCLKFVMLTCTNRKFGNYFAKHEFATFLFAHKHEPKGFYWCQKLTIWEKNEVDDAVDVMNFNNGQVCLLASNAITQFHHQSSDETTILLQVKMHVRVD